MPTLNWIGKEKVINHHLDVPYRVLDHKYSYDEKGQHDGDNEGENKIIRGDNLEALKALLPQYEGKIKCIYIDPPYNTGNEKWVYNDNVNDPKMKKWLGEVVGKEGEDLSRHDKWLCMMYPRLKLLQRLLADDGAVFISIDDNEQALLRLICDEIFGYNNFINNVIWQKKYSPQNDAKYFSDMHDFIIVYAKNKMNWDRNLLPRSDEQNNRYKNMDNDSRGPWKSSDLSVKTYSPDYDYPIETPGGRIVNPPQGRCWRTSKDNFQKLVEDNRIWFGVNGNNVPSIKRFLSEVQDGQVPVTLWLRTDVGDNQEARQELKKVFSDSAFPFDTPKPPRLIERILQIATDKNSIVLDSFAGSGTTAHAVLNMNKEDGGNRKFILVEMEDYAESITAERVKRAINGYGDVDATGGSFSFYDLGEPLLLENQYLNENISAQKIREYVYFMETKNVLPENKGSYYLDTHNSTAYYFYYEKESITTLNYSFLKTMKEPAENYVIYADNCTLSEEELLKYHITFKKIPRDIARL